MGFTPHPLGNDNQFQGDITYPKVTDLTWHKNNLACKLAATCGEGEAPVILSEVDPIEETTEPPLETTAQIEEDDGWPWWAWTGIGLVAVGVLAAASGGSSDSSSGGGSSGGSSSTCPAGEGNCGSAEYTW